MDFLDPQKQRAHTIRIFVGYILIGIALVLTTIILLYHAYGFGVDRNGNVVQNGLVFISSTPNPADIYVNDKQYKEDTNARMLLSSGQYTVAVKRDGYRDWRRAITVEGGSVERFDYPFLFPAKLQTVTAKAYTKQPALATQSLDRKWLLVQAPDSNDTFDMYDLSKPDDVAKNVEQVAVPASAFTSAQGAHTWELVQWSTDNKHVVLKHLFQKDGKTTHEFVLFNRDQPAESVNLTSTLGTNPTTIELRDQKYDQYYLHDAATGALTTASLKEPAPKPYLSGVLSFKSYADDTMLYSTTQDAGEGKVAIKLRQGAEVKTIRSFPAGSKYPVNLTRYDGDWYVAAGSEADGRVFVYKNPLSQLKEEKVAVPVRILKVAGVNYVAFSANTRFVMAENGSNFAVYDAENDKGYTFDVKAPLDAPQTHATWMDGHRIVMTSNGMMTVFDYDGSNKQVLLGTQAKFLPFFDRDYEYLYSFGGAEGMTLQKTPMRLEKDL